MADTLLTQIKQGGKGQIVNIPSRYHELLSDRNGYLNRGQEYSRLTLPYVLPESDNMNRGDAANQHGYQSIGAQAVKHLANKLSTTLFPIGRSFFKLDFEPEIKYELEQEGYNPADLQQLLVEAEDRATSLQIKIASRVAYVEALTNLIISGNSLLYLPSNGFLQNIKLDKYVISRDINGNVLELIILYRKSFNTMSKETQDIIRSIKAEEPKKDEIIDLYTWVYSIDKETYGVAQAAGDILIKPYQQVEKKKSPWIPLRWNSTSGESYGRGHVEDNSGDFYVIEFLSEAIAKGAVLMSDVKYLLKPGSVTDIDEIASAPTGEWVFGDINDVGVLQLEKYADFTPVSEVLNEYKRRIGQAFLINSAIRRDAERVTTVELRLDAQELETSLGGIYSLLSQTFQTPLAYLYLQRIGFTLAEELVTPDIITGLEAFAKTGDLDKITQFTEILQQTQAWPVPVQQRIKWGEFIKIIASKLSLKQDFLMNEKEWEAYQQQMQQQQQNQAMMEAGVNAAPNMVNQLGDKIGGIA